MTLSPDNRVIQGMWRGRPLSNLERLCIQSFIANGHEFHLYLDGDPGGVPEIKGLKIFDIADVIPRIQIDQYLHGASIFSDWFRGELLWQKGGWFVELDMICLRPFDFPEPIVFGRVAEQNFASSAIKVPAHHPLAKAISRSACPANRFCPWDSGKQRRIKIKHRLKRLQFWKDSSNKQRLNDETGAMTFTLVVKYFDLAHLAQPIPIFYLLADFFTEAIVTEQLHDMDMLAPFLHHTAAIHMKQRHWDRRGWDRNATYPENSLYEVLKRRYLPPS